MQRPAASWPARFVVLAALVAVVGGCAPVTIIRAGEGPATTEAFRVDHGFYHVHWVVRDPQTTRHGCLFGLSIDVVRTGVADLRDLPDWASQKLIYRSLTVGTELVGDRTNLELPTGSYVMRSEVNCAWRAEIVQDDGGIAPPL